MAKIALCGYGHDGRGLGNSVDGYAYVVNDNVNVGDVLQVVATNWKSGKKFGTTAQTLQVNRESSMEGQLNKAWGEEMSRDGELTQVYSGSQLGVKGFRGGEAYKQQVRAQNLQQYMQTHEGAEMTKNASKLVENYGNPNGAQVKKDNYQSFAEYSKPFMGDK